MLERYIKEYGNSRINEFKYLLKIHKNQYNHETKDFLRDRIASIKKIYGLREKAI